MSLLALTDVSTVIINSFEGVVTQTVEMFAGIAPAALTVFGVTYMWKKAKGFFTKA